MLDFKSHPDNVADAVASVIKAIDKKVTYPVLAGIKISVDSDSQQVTLTGFNTVLGIKKTFRANVYKSGECVLDAKILKDITNKSSAMDMHFVANQDSTKIKINSIEKKKKSSYEFSLFDVEDYPDLPILDESLDDNELNLTSVKITAESLIDAVNFASVAYDKGDVDSIKKGIRFNLTANKLKLAATNGHHLTLIEVNNDEILDADMGKISFVVLGDYIKKITELMNKNTGLVSVKFNEKVAVFEFEDIKLVVRLLSGSYPELEQVIPRQFKISATVNRLEFIKALETISLLSDIGSKRVNSLVKMSLECPENSLLSSLILSCEAQDVGKGKEALNANIEGLNNDSISIAFNSKNVTEGLKSFNCENVVFNINTSQTPVVITTEDNFDSVYLFMPVSLRDVFK